MTACFATVALILLAVALTYGRFKHEQRKAERRAERPSRGGINEFHSSSSDIPGAK